MYQGMNGYSLVISVADGLYQIYQEEYTQALTHTVVSASYMACLSAIHYIGIPYLSVVYSIIVTTYTMIFWLLFKWINRRSQKKSMSYEIYSNYLQHNPLPMPRICYALY